MTIKTDIDEMLRCFPFVMRKEEETTCATCGRPLWAGEKAFAQEVDDKIYCSRGCFMMDFIRKSA